MRHILVAAVTLTSILGLMLTTRMARHPRAVTAVPRFAQREPAAAGPPRPTPREYPIYGPPSPRPIYGPPSPPSRVPLLDILADPRRHVLSVPQDSMRPTPRPSSQETLPPVGWDTLDLSRGIPFFGTRSTPPGASSGAFMPADGRRILLEQAARDLAPVTVVYCLDTSAEEDYLRASMRAIAHAVSSMGRNDRMAVIVSGQEPSILVPLTNAQENGLTQELLDGAAKLRTATPGGSLASTLTVAQAVQGVTHIVLIAQATGALSDGDARWFREQVGRATSPPRCLALVIGDGAPTPRARALLDIAVATGGAFAWLRPGKSR